VGPGGPEIEEWRTHISSVVSEHERRIKEGEDARHSHSADGGQAGVKDERILVDPDHGNRWSLGTSSGFTPGTLGIGTYDCSDGNLHGCTYVPED